MHLRFIVVAVLFVAGCVPSAVDPRLAVVHHTYSTLGLVQTGPIDHGSLQRGASVVHTRQLESSRCYQVLVLGERGLRGIELHVRDPHGRPMRRRTSSETFAALRVCPDESGPHEIGVHALTSGGTYSMTLWAAETSVCGAPLTFDSASATQAEGGARQWVLDGSTAEAESTLTSTCAYGDARDQVYRITIDARTRLRASLEAEYDGVLYLSSTCGRPDTEIACNDDAGDARHSRVWATLDPGEYYLVVDGYGEEAGDYRLTVETVPTTAIGNACERAVPMEPGQERRLSPSESDYFDSECNPVGGPENVFHLSVAERSRVQLARNGTGLGAVSILSDCDGDAVEITCAPRETSTVLDPGEYFVVVEGADGTVQADIEPLLEGDAICGEVSVVPLPLNGSVRGNTRGNGNRFEASCAASAQSDDAVYVLRIERPATVRLLLMSSFDGTLHLRTSCQDAATEVACNDDAQDPRHSLIIRDLAPGDYFVIVDGYGQGNSGPFELRTITTPQGLLPSE